MLFGMTFLQAIAATKVINIFSSGVATAVFVYRGMVDLKLGISLGIVMFLGALIGGRLSLRSAAFGCGGYLLRRYFASPLSCSSHDFSNRH